MAQTVRAGRLYFIALINHIVKSTCDYAFTIRTRTHTLTLRRLQLPHSRRDFRWDLREAVVYRLEGSMVEEGKKPEFAKGSSKSYSRRVLAPASPR